MEIFSSGWENSKGVDVTDNGLWSGYRQVYGYVNVTSNIVREGNYALNITTVSNYDMVYVYKNLDVGYGALFTRAYFYMVEHGIEVGRYVPIFEFYDSEWADHLYALVGVMYTSNGLKWYCLYLNGTSYQNLTGNTLSSGRFYRVEAYLSIGDDGILEVKINGVTEFSLRVDNNRYGTMIRRIHLGPRYSEGSTLRHQSILDSIVIDDEWYPGADDFRLTIGTDHNVAGKMVTFYAHIVCDYANLSGGIFGTNNTGTWVNETWMPFESGHNEYWLNVTKILNETVGARIEFQFWVNNTNGEWATKRSHITTTQTSVDYYWNSVWVNTTKPGSVAEFSIKWKSEAGRLSHGVLEINNTGTFQNITIPLNGEEDWMNISIRLNSSYEVIQWKAYANNTFGHWGKTFTFYLHSRTVEPWDYTQGTKIYRVGEGEYPMTSLSWQGDYASYPQTGNWHNVNETGYENRFDFNEDAIRHSCEAMRMVGIKNVGCYFTFEPYVLNNRATIDGHNTARINFLEAHHRMLSIMEEYGISRSYEVYMLTFNESRKEGAPYPPYYNNSLEVVSSRDDWVQKYYNFIVEFSNHSNVWFYTYNEPKESFDKWFDVVAELFTKVRGAGIHHILGIQYGYCGGSDARRAIDWFEGYPRGNLTRWGHRRNVVFRHQVFPGYGTFGGINTTYEEMYYWICGTDSGHYAYDYIVQTLKVPLIARFGPYHYTGEDWKKEITYSQNLMKIARLLGFYVQGYRWNSAIAHGYLSRPRTYWLYEYNEIGNLFIKYAFDKPFVFSVGNGVLKDGTDYIYSNNTEWTSVWLKNSTLKVIISGTGNTMLRVFWNVSGYELNSSVKVKFQNGTAKSALDFFDNNSNLIKIPIILLE